MKPIDVPPPPASSFNKNRRVSDLLLSQVKHFQHIAQKREMQIDPALERDVANEAGAARYIARVTRAIRSQARPSIVAMPSPGPAATATKPGVVEEMAAAPQSPAVRPAKASARKARKSTKAQP